MLPSPESILDSNSAFSICKLDTDAHDVAKLFNCITIFQEYSYMHFCSHKILVKFQLLTVVPLYFS